MPLLDMNNLAVDQTIDVENQNVRRLSSFREFDSLADRDHVVIAHGAS
jgi:hypothetical protein